MVFTKRYFCTKITAGMEPSVQSTLVVRQYLLHPFLLLKSSNIIFQANIDKRSLKKKLILKNDHVGQLVDNFE